jgi:hypothetical protein
MPSLTRGHDLRQPVRYEIERRGVRMTLNKQWYYGKLSASHVGILFFANYYALSENYGDYEQDYSMNIARPAVRRGQSDFIALLKNAALDGFVR